MANNEFIAGIINGSPCGCAGCEKWADCDYCGTCTPEVTDTIDWSLVAATDAEEEMMFSEWLASR